MTQTEQQNAARLFASRWKGKGYEKGESQIFWVELLTQVFGILSPSEYLSFEQQVRLDHTSFIDAYIPRTHVMIEQKSIEKDLGAPVRQSDGSLLNPFQQAKRYAAELPYSQRPRWIVTCNFREFRVYDMERPNAEPQVILLENLEKEWYRLQFLVDEGNDHLRRETEVSVKAGELVGMIYDKLLEQYRSVSVLGSEGLQSLTSRSDILRSLNILCVRLVFCLYAEDAGLFPSRTSFHDYLTQFPAKHIRNALIRLFEVLDTPLADRDPYLEDDLAAFPYVNGGLFGDSILIPNFTDDLKTLLLEKASADFDWSEISPTIFGAVFESTLNPETRRSGGMHYTSIENIHKVIDPLFLDGLKAEFAEIYPQIKQIEQKGNPLNLINLRTKTNPQIKQIEPKENQSGFSAKSVKSVDNKTRQRLAAFQDKLASLTFFDPACGSGNFLTETYLSLRRLENEVILAMYGGANILTFDTLIKVNISQFHGIEINDFACTVAKTALWIAENQMMQQTSAIAGKPMDFLPLKTNANIVEGNALRMDWSSLFIRPQIKQIEQNDNPLNLINLRTNNYPDYIIGNPPFVGASMMTAEQKQEAVDIFGKIKLSNSIDYVGAWYHKAAALMQQAKPKLIRAALVSTNSITQGEQVAALWQPLLERYGLRIDFAWRTFRWDSEADIKAHVHCVIIGFSLKTDYRDTIGIPKGYTKTIYLSDNQTVNASNINPYLIDAPDVMVESRAKPVCDVEPMIYGNKPTDGGNFILTEEEKAEVLRREPGLVKYIHPYIGAVEFINNKTRYCFWLKDISPMEIKNSHILYERVQNVKALREASTSSATRQKACVPNEFFFISQPATNYLIIPRVSSENRRYVPIGFMQPETIASDACSIIPNATLFHFGVLTSNIHMAWMRVVAGRLKSDYRYSGSVVYNNFPWCHPTDEQKAKIEQTAQAILDARAKHPDCSLAVLYDEVTMPPELRRAHQDNDRAVMDAYGFSPKMTESECVAELFKMYQEMTNK